MYEPKPLFERAQVELGGAVRNPQTGKFEKQIGYVGVEYPKNPDVARLCTGIDVVHCTQADHVFLLEQQAKSGVFNMPGLEQGPTQSNPKWYFNQ